MADAGRVIAGSARGVRLRAPGPGTRPLSDRVKQTLFAILEPDLPGAAFLDLFAGSGAAGIEALSRGAASATFVEKDQGAAAVIDANLKATALAGPAASVVRWDVVRWLGESHPDERFDLVVVDPPYAETELLGRILAILGGPDAPHRARCPRRREALLARPTARADRYAGGRARPPVRRDGPDLLSTPGGRMSTAVYPGSFDPITNGHVDVIRRAAAAFDRIVVGVLANPRKQPLLSVDDRVDIIRAAVREAGVPADRIDVQAFDGLTVEFCHAVGAGFIVRGLRAISDFESEMQLAHNNRKLAGDVDTVFFMTAVEYGYVSSSLVKEIASFDGDVSAMIPAAALGPVMRALAARR